MINVEQGKVHLKGNRVELMLDLTMLFKTFVDKGLFGEKELKHSWELANLSDEETEAQAKEAAEDMMQNMIPALIAYAAAGSDDAMELLDEIMPELKRFMEKEHGEQ